MLKNVASHLRRLLNFPKSTSPGISPNPVKTSHTMFNENVAVASQPKPKYTRRPRPTVNTTGMFTTISSTRPRESIDHNTPIIWLDLEMTGLDIAKDVIMEIGCIITSPNLDEVDRLPEIIINVPGTILDTMDAWCISTHGATGLTESCRTSALSNSAAEDKLLAFLQKHTEAGVCPLGGNSVTYDRIFLKKYMPRVLSHLHYRSIDVSTIKELVRRWYPKEFSNCPPKRFIHKTMADIEDSINELKYYRSTFFVPPSSAELKPSGLSVPSS